jgi:GDP-4-dehydro-6-deoxy-D-mannose reductase
MKVLITGATGMIGMHLVAEGLRRGWDVTGLSRGTSAGRQLTQHAFRFVECDITDREHLVSVMEQVRPELVMHMAAQAFNGISWKCEHLTHQLNYLGTVNVLGACRKACPEAKVLLACSSAEYGDVQPEDCPLKEDRPLRPITPYGVSKVATELLGYQYFKNFGMQVYFPRLFIHVGTGHPPATAIQNFARQLVEIKKGKRQPVMQVGRMDTARDFIDVRDGVVGMLLLLERGRPGVPVNVCTGEALSIREIMTMLSMISGVKPELAENAELLRPSDEPLLMGDNARLKALGWQRRFTMQQTLEAVFADWMSRV